MQRRSVTFDGDFRRNPKTDFFCCICQRDLNPKKQVDWVFLGEEFCSIIHPEDVNNDDIKAPVGSECKKQIPVHYRV